MKPFNHKPDKPSNTKDLQFEGGDHARIRKQ